MQGTMNTINKIEWEREMLELCNNSTMDWISQKLKPRKIVDHVEGYVIVADVFRIALAIVTSRRSVNPIAPL